VQCENPARFNPSRTSGIKSRDEKASSVRGFFELFSGILGSLIHDPANFRDCGCISQKKGQGGLNFAACALKSFCGSVEMGAPISSIADPGSLFLVLGLESEHINRAAAHVPVSKQYEFGE